MGDQHMDRKRVVLVLATATALVTAGEREWANPPGLLARCRRLLSPDAALACQHDRGIGTDGPPAVILPGLGDHHHPIATASPDAQLFFDQGLRLVFAFNHDEAVRAFQRAATLDPTAAMPLWGIALALGPNINLDIDPERERAAYDA